ncbi:MAG: class I SAM-dependent methyltransferase [Planctomycetia bacterium]|nr:class I SAM-dependent methyltransferase [Planctomycetia bacterium]
MTDFNIHTWQWLMSPEAESFFREVNTFRSRDKKTDPYRLTIFLREKCGLSPERAAAVVSQTELRHRAKRKFPSAESMFFTPVGLEQSTDAFIAAYKASRFPPDVLVADLCCGIGGDLMALAHRGPVLGLEKDPIIATVAAENLRTLSFTQNPHKYHVLCDDVSYFPDAFPPEKIAFLHLDPDRRPAGIRSTRMEFFSPSEEVLDHIFLGRTLCAVKLAPATTLPEKWSRNAELEWIARDGECRQLVAWIFSPRNIPSESLSSEIENIPQEEQKPYDFSFHVGMHRATIIAPDQPSVLGTIVGFPDSHIPLCPAPKKYIFDINPAVLAAKLTAELTRRHSLHAFLDDIPYLTGDHPITSDAALSCFQILEILPFDKKHVTAAIKKLGWGTLEIKKRGDTPTPEDVRKWLKLPPSKESGTLFLIRTPQRTLAILAIRILSSTTKDTADLL